MVKETWGLLGSAVSVQMSMEDIAKRQEKGDIGEEELKVLEQEMSGKVSLFGTSLRVSTGSAERICFSLLLFYTDAACDMARHPLGGEQCAASGMRQRAEREGRAGSGTSQPGACSCILGQHLQSGESSSANVLAVCRRVLMASLCTPRSNPTKVTMSAGNWNGWWPKLERRRPRRPRRRRDPRCHLRLPRPVPLLPKREAPPPSEAIFSFHFILSVTARIVMSCHHMPSPSHTQHDIPPPAFICDASSPCP